MNLKQIMFPFFFCNKSWMQHSVLLSVFFFITAVSFYSFLAPDHCVIRWKITYDDIYPLAVKATIFEGFLLVLGVKESAFCFFLLNKKCEYLMQGILINGQFPGPQIDAVTNENMVTVLLCLANFWLLGQFLLFCFA